MNSRLPVRPIPVAGESPASVLMRAVQSNGYPSLQALIWAYFGIGQAKGWVKASYVDPRRFGQIVNALGIEEASSGSPAFSRNGPTSESDRILGGMAVPEKLFRDDGRYYCPDCLKEHKFWRALWTLRPYSVCPEHGKLLLRDCTVCGAKLEPWRGKLVVCQCGADLREALGKPADPAAVEWWLACHRSGRADPKLVDATLLAMAASDELGDLPGIEHIRLTVTREWVLEGKTPAYLVELVQQRSEYIHPRLQLLPMLRSKFSQIRDMARAILCLWAPCDQARIEESGRGIQTREAELALGISRFQLEHFKRLGLVPAPAEGKRVRGHVSIDSVNHLLYAMQAHQTDGQKTEARPPTVSTATIVRDILSGARQGAGYDVVRGLSTLRLIDNGKCEVDEGVGEDWLNVTEVAAVLKTYPDAVRFVVRKGWLPARHRDLQNRKRLIARRADVDTFDRQYVFSGVLAKELKVNPTTLGEKLMELGAQPVSGQSVDGALVYLFRRGDVAQIREADIRGLKTYKTRAGRPKNSTKLAIKAEVSPHVLIVEAASLLGIGVQKIRTLVSKGILVKASTKTRAVFLERDSLDKLQALLRRTDLIPLEEAAARFNQTPKTFNGLWVKSKIIEVYELVHWRLISVRALQDLAEKLEGKLTAAEAGRLKSMHRSHLPNLERRGAVSSVRVGAGTGIRLYDRSDIEGLG